MNKIYLYIFSCIVLSCSFGKQTKKVITSGLIKEKNCFETDTIKLFKEILKNPKKLISMNDSCRIQVIYIHKKYILENKNNELGYHSLNSILEHSDGYLTEEILYLIIVLFEKDYVNFSTFLFKHKKKGKSEIENLFMDGICVKIIDSNDKTFEMKKITDYIDSFNQPEINGYIKNLIETIDYERCS